MGKSVNGKSVTVIWVKNYYKNDANGEGGTLYIRTIDNKKVSRKSLDISIKKKFFIDNFIPETDRFRKNARYPELITYNNKIEKTFNNLKAVDNKIADLPNDRKSFIMYWKSVIAKITKHGTKIKHEVVLGKLLKFLDKTKGKRTLLFSEIDLKFIENLKHYLSTEKDPKQLTLNSVNHYLKMIRSIVKRADLSDEYHFVKDPFKTLTFEREPVKRRVLNEAELALLLDTPINDKKVDEARNMFLFQLFCNGMRVSDLLIIKWSNIRIVGNSAEIRYEMFKTKAVPPAIRVNLNLATVLGTMLDLQLTLKQLKKSEVIYIKDERHIFSNDKYGGSSVTLEDLEGHINKLLLDPYGGPMPYYATNYTRIGDVHASENMGEVLDYYGYKINKSETEVMKFIDIKERLLDQIEAAFINQVVDAIRIKKLKNNHDFIFNITDNKEFKSIRNFALITENEYKTMKHLSIVYNRKLKDVAKLCGLEDSISSHVSRHSFTNLVRKMEGIDSYDVSQLLAHKSLASTQKYLLEGFDNEKLTEASSNFAKSHSRKR